MTKPVIYPNCEEVIEEVFDETCKCQNCGRKWSIEYVGL